MSRLMLHRYPAYRDSGLPWLGRIPAHWEVHRNGRLFAERRETADPTLPILEVSLRTGVRVRNLENGARKQVMADRSKYQRARAGDIVYNTMRMWQGAVGVAPADGLVSPAYVVARPRPDVEPRYYAYLFRTGVYLQQVEIESRGIVPDRNRLYWDAFKRMPSVYPPAEDQHAIAAFLDAHGHLGRRFERAKRKLVVLLEEQKNLLIRRAVTCGMSETAVRGPAGVPWMSEAPLHWRRRHLGREVDILSGYPFDASCFGTERGHQVVRIRDIGSTTTSVLYDGSDVPEARIYPGDLLVGMDGDFNVALWRGESALLNQRVCCIRPHASIDRDYLAYLLPLPLQWINDTTFSTTVKHLSTTDIRCLRLPLPDLAEQRAIVDYIRSSTRSLEQAQDRVRAEIALAREYHERLVADVITGRLDIRHTVDDLVLATVADESGLHEDDVDEDVADAMELGDDEAAQEPVEVDS